MNIPRILIAGALVALACAAAPAAAQVRADPREGRISVADRDGGTYSPELNWRCAGDSGYYLYVSGTPLTDDSLLTAQWRFDDEQPQEATWVVTPRHAWANTAVNAFTIRALSAREVSIRLTNSGGSTFTSRYALRGVREAMSNLPCLRAMAAAAPASP